MFEMPTKLFLIFLDRNLNRLNKYNLFKKMSISPLAQLLLELFLSVYL
jgi:hypothetical protein